MDTLLGSIIELLFGGLTTGAAAIGGGLQAFVTSIFVVATTTEAGTTYDLSVFGGLIVIFAAISITIGISRWVLNWLTSFGN